MHRPSHVEQRVPVRHGGRARTGRPTRRGYPLYPTLSHTLQSNAGGVRRGAAPNAKVAFSDLGDGTTRQIQMRQARRATPATLRMQMAGVCEQGCAHSHHAASR